ncbi:MAG: hypothetical protein ACC619_01605 [Paracoccaceae bacterium]
MTAKFGARAIGIAVGFLAGLLAVAASAQQPPPVTNKNFDWVQNWQPSDFSISCGTEEGQFRPPQQQTSCFGGGRSQLDFEDYTSFAANFFESNEFDSPYHFGPVIDAFNRDGKSIRVFTSSDPFNAAIATWDVNASGNICDREGFRTMQVNLSRIRAFPPFAIALVGSHELFHAVQMGIPGNLSKGPSRFGEDKCFPPPWIEEAQADAAGIDFVRRVFPDSFPPDPKTEFGYNMAGVRPYYLPLNLDDKSTGYNTNSFWLYLGDRFHGKRFKYMLDYNKVAAPKYDGDKEDWLRWLDQQLLKDTDVRAPLSLVYPAFLTNFAAEWGPGGVGEKFGRTSTNWLTSTFGDCPQVTVSPEEPYVEFDILIEKMAGRCLSVKIAASGYNSSDLMSVKIGVLADSVEIANGLHLGFAVTNDQTGFNCAKITRKGKLPRGIVGCLLEPVTGVFEGAAATELAPAARMWNGTSLEKGAGPTSGGYYMGDPGGQTSGPAGLDIENVYILSYVPTRPWEQLLQGKPPINVKVGVGLDWSTLSVNGSDVNSGPADGKRTQTRIRAASGLAGRPADTDRIIPASTGYIDMDQAEEFFGQASVDLLTATTKMISTMTSSSPGLATFDGFVFRIAEVRVTPLGAPAPIDDELLDIIREYTVLTEKELPLGTTGTFDAVVLGIDFENTNVGYITAPNDFLKLTVLENSRGAFRARVSGRLCQTDALRMLLGGAQICQRMVPFSASISKPFAYLYQSGSQLISQQTEGEVIYNEYNLAREGLGGPLASGPGGTGTGPTGGAGGTGAGATAGSSATVCRAPLVWREFSCQLPPGADGAHEAGQ